MYVSKLSLYGFKSFVKRSEIQFGHGITSIVGPNGCGKTNIVDAIRWVIGEQKSSVLRADRNTDVIFNGTATRRPLNMAEVSLTIHNVTSWSSVELSDVTITRRLYRNGESEYFINNNLCRLKDITDLFIDTGMGANAYSIIELKMIEDILSETPEERKRLFEEAAGVNKYRVQRKAAIRKLEATRDDLVRLNDIINEVDSKVKNLKRQLHRYEKYQEVTQNLIEAEVSLAAKRILAIKLKKDPIYDDILNNRMLLQKTITEQEKSESDWQEKQKEIEQKEDKLQLKSLEDGNLRSELNKLQTDNLLLKEQHRNITKTIARLANEIDSHNKNISTSEEHKVALKDELQKVTNDLEIKRNSFKSLTEKLAEVDVQYKVLSKELQTLQEERYSLFRQQAEYLARYNSLAENIQQREKELQSVVNKIDEQAQSEAEYIKEIAETKGKIDRINKELSSKRDDIQSQENCNQELLREEQTIRYELRNVESELDKLSNRIQFYSGIIQSKEGFEPGLQYVLDHLSDFPGIKGALSDLLSVDSKYYLAVDTVIKDISRLLITESRSSAIAAIRKLADIGKGRVSIIPLDVAFPGTTVDKITEASIQPLNQFIKCSPSLNRLKEFLFQNIYVCEDSDFERLIEDKRFDEVSLITEKGRYRDANGFFTGGSESSESNLLVGRNEKLYEYKKKFDKLSGEKNDIQGRLKKILSNLEQTALSQKNLTMQIRELEIEQRSVEENLRSAESRLLQSKGIQKSLNENKVTILVALESFKSKQSRENPESKIISEQIESLDTRILQKTDDLAKIKLVIDDYNTRIQNGRIELLNLENKYRNIINNQEVTEKSIKSMTDARNTAIQEKNKNVQIKLDIDLKIETNDNDIKRATDKLEKVENELQGIRTDYQNQKVILQQLSDRLMESRHSKEKLSDELKNLELEFSRLEAAENEIRSVLVEKYGRNIPDEIPSTLPEEETLRHNVERFKRNLEMIGMVNMAVKDEFEQENARLRFLTEQRDDLVASEKGLNEVIFQIDKNVREQFVDIFNKIRCNFQSTFSIFFNGGEADVRLIGDPDPLESQIEIWACPSGKKMRSLKMLSAGEKALTAIALLFAIYQVKPSPFCILDEVDSPLDDQNTIRFTNVLKTFSNNTQFIVVTHNKSTMSIADALYGITMAEKGVSQIISARLE